MKKLLLLVMALFLTFALAGCVADNNEDTTEFEQFQMDMWDNSQQGMPMMGLDSTNPDIGMVYPYYYGEVWDSCTINGVEYSDVSIIYTSLGLAYQVENTDGSFTRVFMPDLEIQFCTVELYPVLEQ